MLISKIIYAIDAFTDDYFQKRVYILYIQFTIIIIKLMKSRLHPPYGHTSKQSV